MNLRFEDRFGFWSMYSTILQFTELVFPNLNPEYLNLLKLDVSTQDFKKLFMQLWSVLKKPVLVAWASIMDQNWRFWTFNQILVQGVPRNMTVGE